MADEEKTNVAQSLPVRMKFPIKTALHQSVLDERLHQTKLLMNNMLNIDMQDVNGWTPLMLTCMVDNEHRGYWMMKLFLKRGARVNCRDKMGRTPLMLASIFGKTRLVRKLLEQDNVELDATDTDGNNALIHSAARPDSASLMSILNAFLCNSLNVDARNTLGYTALLMACRMGQHSNAYQLVKLGHASPYLRDHEYRFNARDWTEAFNTDEAGRIPMLNKPPLQSEQNIQLKREKVYFSTIKLPNVMSRSEGLPRHSTSNCSVQDYASLKNLLSEEDQEQPRYAGMRSGRVFRASRGNREVTTAQLRSVDPTNGTRGKTLNIGHMFTLYASECTQRRNAASSIQVPRGNITAVCGNSR